MPDPKDNAKLTGDTHPPELDDDLTPSGQRDRPEAQDTEAAAPGSSLGRGAGNEGRGGKGTGQAGSVKDQQGDAGRKSGKT
jgi:hypothetical protein